MYGRHRYKQNRLTTAQPGDLIVMLYDGMLKFMDVVINAMDEKDYAQAGIHVSKVVDIVAYLQAVLRTDAAPDLAASLDTTYSSWSLHLVQANVNKDKDKFINLREQMQGLRDAWDEINQAAANAGSEAKNP